MISVGIIGGSGYTGKKLVQFCHNHPYITNYSVYGNSTAGEQLYSVFPDLAGVVENSLIKSMDELEYEHEVYFIALPHGEALKYVPMIIAAGKKVIDLGGDYRFDMPEIYKKWYKIEHSSPYLLKKKLYGLADVNENDYSDFDLVANPGCYPTASLLSLLPLVKYHGNNIIAASTIAYSGTSGAGKSANTELLLSEMDGNVKAYNVNTHRHQPEIMQHLYKYGFTGHYSFTTHLLPVAVGIYATTAVHLNSSISAEELIESYKVCYDTSSFVRLRPAPPQLKWVTGTNFCDINVSVQNTTVIITAAIDNLIKGASGQAVQNMNKLFGWDEKLGILNTGDKYVSVY